jgi:hypothetical protein
MSSSCNVCGKALGSGMVVKTVCDGACCFRTGVHDECFAHRERTGIRMLVSNRGALVETLAGCIQPKVWKRFKAAGDAIYAAKNEEFERDEAEYQANLVVKLEILTDAEVLLASTDFAQARATLNGLQKRWDAAGKVPRAKIREVEDRMRKVETAVRKLEEAHWDKSNPEKQARSEGLAGQIESKIAALEAERAVAQSAGDSARVAVIDEDIAAQRSWLAVLA